MGLRLNRLCVQIRNLFVARKRWLLFQKILKMTLCDFIIFLKDELRSFITVLIILLLGSNKKQKNEEGKSTSCSWEVGIVIKTIIYCFKPLPRFSINMMISI